MNLELAAGSLVAMESHAHFRAQPAEPWRSVKCLGRHSEEAAPIPALIPLSANADLRASRHDPMTAPVPWSLAWSEDGELAPQDRFDLLQSLVQSEGLEVQCSLVALVEAMASGEITALALSDVTGLCS